MLVSRLSPDRKSPMKPQDDSLNQGPTEPFDDATEEIPPPVTLGKQETVKRQGPGVGSMVFDRYRLRRILGRGGMGVVWLATDTRLDRSVALKFLPDAVGADPVALKELKDETRRGLELAHPNIVRIHDFIHDGDTAAISMEFVDGQTLSERRLVKPQRVFSVHDVAPWIGQMCYALDYAHLQRRIVHRDLKPANLMVNKEAEIKITDFGIARTVSDTMTRMSRTIHQQTSGTLLYMSPQQAMGDRPRPTDDVYALGATLYELFTSKPPFYSGDIPTQISTRIPPSLQDRREELEIGATDTIPKEWEHAISLCLDKDPARRPQTAGQLAEWLGLNPVTSTSITSGAPVQPKSMGLRPIEMTTQTAALPSQKSSARGVLLGSLITLALLAGAGVAAFSWWSQRTGEWLVKTEPAGAQVSMNGQTLVAPATLPGLKPGSYRADIALEGFEPRQVEFVVAPGQSVDLGVMKLKRSTGNLLLLSDPAGATYKVWSVADESASTLTGEAPDTLRLPIGKYSVMMKHGSEIKTTYVEIVRNVTSRFAFELPPPPPEPPKPVVASTPPPEPPKPIETPSLPPAASTPAMPASITSAAAAPAPPIAAPTLPASIPTPAPTPAPAPVPPPPSLIASSPLVAPSPAITSPPPTPMPAPAPAAQTPVSVGASFAIQSVPPVTTPIISAPPAPLPTTPQQAMAAIASQPPADNTPKVIAAPAGPAIQSTPPPTFPPVPDRFTPPVRSQPPELPDSGYFSRGDLFERGPYSDYSSYAQQVILKKVQEKLKRSGLYSSSLDGAAGAGTQSAVLDWQREQGLPTSGRLDRATLASLGLTGLPETSPPKRPKPEPVPPRATAVNTPATPAAPAATPTLATPPTVQPAAPPAAAPAAGSIEAQRAMIDSFLKPKS